MRYIGAISDTDILINLAKADRLDILPYLFEEIIIPQFVFDIEIKQNAGKYYSIIVQAINAEGSIFRILDRKNDKAINRLSKDIIDEKRMLIGPGESECAGYAQALRIPIIISDNYTEFKWLDEFITLTYRDILALCVFFDKISYETGNDIFNSINSKLSRPSKNTFSDFYRKSMNDIKQKGWSSYLQIEE